MHPPRLESFPEAPPEARRYDSSERELLRQKRAAHRLAKRTPDPLIEGETERPFRRRGIQMGGLRQQQLPRRGPYPTRKGERYPNDDVVQERHPNLEGVGHRHLIGIPQELVGQVVEHFETADEISRIPRPRAAPSAAVRLDRTLQIIQGGSIDGR
jgi:hypothetical protein